MNHDVFGKVGLYARDKRPGPKLRKCMLAPIRSNHVMARLGPAVIAYNQAGAGLAGQEIGQEAFSAVSETKVYNDVSTQ